MDFYLDDCADADRRDNNRSKDMKPADIVRAVSRLLASGLPLDNEMYALNHWR
jgi:hypothetical protein